MLLARVAVALLPAVLIGAAPGLPELKVEATDGGSVLWVRNTAAQPLTAYFIEMIGYPGSSYALYQEHIGTDPLAAGEQRRIPIVNMTVGAAPEYVKIQSAVYADGSTAGSPEKIAQLIGLRRTKLEVTRELITRVENGRGVAKQTLIADLRKWAESVPETTRRERGTPIALERSSTRDLISTSAAQLEKGSLADLLVTLNASERALSSSKPAL